VDQEWYRIFERTRKCSQLLLQQRKECSLLLKKAALAEKYESIITVRSKLTQFLDELVKFGWI